MKTIENKQKSILDIKDCVSNNVGKSIVIREFNKQGKKIKEYIGSIIQVYDNLFIVKIDANGFCFNKSFSYVDFVTNQLILEIQ